MPLPTIFDTCIPREDVRQGLLTESDFAADLAQMLRGDAPDEYTNPVRFFANTYPTRGLKNLLWNVCRRLSGSGGEAAAIFRLDTNYGGGKTHALIALAHAAQGMTGVANISEFIGSGLLPRTDVRMAIFDGENADPTNGRSMGHGIRAFTPWGEIAYGLAGSDGYARIRKSDESGAAPGAATIKELFGNRPTLVLIDELSFLLTAAFARKNDVWPRPAQSDPDDETATSGNDGQQPGGDDGKTGATGKGGKTPPKPDVSDKAVTAEGVLKEALTHLWEKARGAKFGKIGTLALSLGLLFRALAPMRNRRNMRQVTQASKTWDAKKRPTGSAWPCTANIPAGYSWPCAFC